MTLVEQVARAIAEAYGAEWDHATERDHNRARNLAQAAIKAVLDAMWEPSEDMIWAMIGANDKLSQAMRDRAASDHPEDMPDYDEGDVMIAEWKAALTQFEGDNT